MSGIDRVRFGRRLRDWRLARGWPVGYLAGRAALPETLVRALEGGGLDPELDHLLALEGALGLTRGELLRGQTRRAA